MFGDGGDAAVLAAEAVSRSRGAGVADAALLPTIQAASGITQEQIDADRQARIRESQAQQIVAENLVGSNEQLLESQGRLIRAQIDAAEGLVPTIERAVLNSLGLVPGFSVERDLARRAAANPESVNAQRLRDAEAARAGQPATVINEGDVYNYSPTINATTTLSEAQQAARNDAQDQFRSNLIP